jgi:hypothetical protein
MLPKFGLMPGKSTPREIPPARIKKDTIIGGDGGSIAFAAMKVFRLTSTVFVPPLKNS